MPALIKDRTNKVLRLHLHMMVGLICLLCASNASATLYKCKNAQGQVSFSDLPCPVDSKVTETKSTAKAFAASEVYQSKSEQACFKFHNTEQNFIAPETSTLLSSSKKFVSVKRVGARQLVSITIKSKNEHGIFIKSSFDCLMMGNGETVNQDPYELNE